jgi:dTDP-4-dehydrorhamnose 3,5-epimerase
MNLTALEPPGLVRIELALRRDARGFFVERFNRETFRQFGLPADFVQDNHSRSAPGVLRGLHYQFDPPQGKLVGVTRGRIWDVAVDIRPDSTTFGQNCAVELTDSNGVMLWIPPGFAHGFCVLGDEPADVIYKVDAPWNPAGESGILATDVELRIQWPIRDAVLSSRDQKLPSFASYRAQPVRWKKN